MTTNMRDAIALQKAVRFARMALQTLDAMGPREDTVPAKARLRAAIEALTYELDEGIMRGED